MLTLLTRLADTEHIVQWVLVPNVEHRSRTAAVFRRERPPDYSLTP
jgi:hypothetical protein